MNEAKGMAKRARLASYQMAVLSAAQKNDALNAVADALQKHAVRIFEANQQDLQRSEDEGLAAPLIKRLKFDRQKLQDVVEGLNSLVSLDDPVGHTQMATQLDKGLELYRVSCPIGVIGIIFESRPDALVQISGLAVKSGNTLVLKGGSEAMETNRCLADIIASAGVKAGLPAGFIGLMETRDDVNQLLEMDQDVDLIIPRGSNEFVRYIMDHTRIPVLGHADGVCHLYIDEQADPDMAVRLAVDSKTQYAAVCNAVETVLVHAAWAENCLEQLAQAFRAQQVEIFGCQRVCARIGCQPVTDWHHEYLDYKVSIRIVDDLESAVMHINQFGSGHTETIVTSNRQTAGQFMQKVDSGNIFWNASTRFSDGFRYGFGAEIGISTSKIHARGPVGLEGLMTYQYRLMGQGQIVADYAEGRQHFKHQPLDKIFPL